MSEKMNEIEEIRKELLVCKEIITPNRCRITRIIDYKDSLHIYHTDKSEAEKIKKVITSPQEIND